MKKSIILLAFVLGAFTANAQSVVEGTKFTDNWSVEVNAGKKKNSSQNETPINNYLIFGDSCQKVGNMHSKSICKI